MIFGAAIPHSLLLYPMIWNDPCSDMFFEAFEFSVAWIASLNALEVITPLNSNYFRVPQDAHWAI